MRRDFSRAFDKCDPSKQSGGDRGRRKSLGSVQTLSGKFSKLVEARTHVKASSGSPGPEP